MIQKCLSLLPFATPVALCLFSFGHAKTVTTSMEEGLELRQIAEYWKERDFSSAKLHIYDFLDKNQNNEYADPLYAMLGDMFFQENNFKEALLSYEKIKGKEFLQKSEFQRLQCLYKVGNYEKVAALAPKVLKNPNVTRENCNTIRLMLAEAHFQKAYAAETTSQKKELYQQALTDYLQLVHTEYSDLTLLPQAQIYAILEDYPKAAAAYLHLAHKEEDKKEDYLFLAASFQLHFDKKAAISTFEKICALGGNKASKAAFNQLNLLFHEKNYRAFILAHEKCGKLISQEKQPLIHYYLGKSLVYLEDYARAIAPLTQAIASKNLETAQEKGALLAMIACAKQIADYGLFEKTLVQLKHSFPYDDETASALLMYTQACADRKDWSSVHQNIAALLECYPQHPQRTSLLYDDALAYVQENKWQEGAEAFEIVLREVTEGEQRTNALRHYVHCRMQDASGASREAEKVKKELLICALEGALGSAKAFSPPERQKMRFSLAKSQFDLGEYEEAIGMLTEYVKDYPKASNCADAYLMLALSYKNGSQDDVHFAINMERALALNSKLGNAGDLHISLYNTYLSLAAEALDEEKGELIEKAADHLYAAFDRSADIKNKRWLANYFYQQSKKGKCGALEKTAIVLEKLLSLQEDSYSVEIDAGSMEKEAEMIRLADVYARTGRSKERKLLLEALVRAQTQASTLPWKFQRMALFELGKSYLEAGDEARAFDLFEELITSSSHTPSYFATAAKIEWAKLKFALLPASEKREDATAVQEICDALKEVQIKRKLHSEPLHLEAALEYISIKAALFPHEQKAERTRFLLEQMKENFSSPDDPFVAEYLSVESQFPENAQLFHQYMQYIAVEADRLQALDAKNLAHWDQMREKLQKLDSQTTNELLKKRIAQSREALEKLL